MDSCGWDHLRTLRQYDYFRPTWNAVERFLHGDNWYTPDYQGIKYGWLSAFINHNSYFLHLEQILNRPNTDNIHFRSHELWEEAGRPWGRNFWNEAKEQLIP